jgi:excinuclease UvrABC nuclease subunit
MSPWQQMDARPRISMSELAAAAVPTSAGVYALYREGNRMYVGKAGCLRDRVWRNHSGKGLSMGTSAMRRNVAQHLDIATANAIKRGEYSVTTADAERVRAWLEGCDIAWVECASEADAVALETAMKNEFLPPLTKQ